MNDIATIISRMRGELEDKGVFTSPKEKLVRETWRKLNLPTYDKCQRCGEVLPWYLREFCSGDCMHAV